MNGFVFIKVWLEMKKVKNQSYF